MANTNAPYGFRLFQRLSGGTGGTPLAPGIAGAPSGSVVEAHGSIQFASTTVMKVGDPVKTALGVGSLAATTNAVMGVLNSPVPAGYGDTATSKHYPEILPADDDTVFRAQAIGTVNITQGLIGITARRKIGGSTSGYTGVDFGAGTTTGAIVVVGLAPGSAFGTYAEVLVIFARGTYYGQA